MMKNKIKKVYAEITNICNLDCSFCHKTKREKEFITIEDFRAEAIEIKTITDYVYLHLLGEPLLHPNLDKILDICNETKLKVNITTNGTLIESRGDLLRQKGVRKVSFSLHSFEANSSSRTLLDYLLPIIDFAKKRGDIIVELRFWNENGENNKLNGKILEILSEHFFITDNLKIEDNLYIGRESLFEWPDLNNPNLSDKTFCYGLKDQIGILSNGVVTPCCLDAEGDIPLGNIRTEKLLDIINNERSQNIIKGFQNGYLVENLCKRCQFNIKKN